ncbi:MAG: hypothetical protein K9J12_00255 [Melioribacteraceae bacterium]|nr:hypothetical protein [Melioribacteraceae bacterium]MCF8265020.1 hypothetical protein [Melioribacteraceae bacterium]MCF8413817.1 hypothetical protein [Melioribacteraceae bacterium]
MKNREIILKYLSDLMSEKERSDLEKRLDEDDNLKSELLLFQNKMNLLQIDENAVDDRYFSSLIPKIREKLDEKVSRPMYKLIFPLSGVVTTLLIFLIGFNNTKDIKEFDNYLISEDEFEIFSDESVSFMIESELAFNNSIREISRSDGYIDNNLINKISTSDSEIEMMELPVVDDYYIYNEIASDDLEEIYSNINEIDFFEGG